MAADPLSRSFDLTSEPWLPVQRLDGSMDVLSLRGVFTHAGTLRRIVGDLPTQEFALLRLLLAVLHDVTDGPEDPQHWCELWEQGLPLAAITEYLDTHRERFDLVHPETPFFQVAGLHTEKGEVSSLDRLVADVPTGNRFFTMRARGVDRLDFAEAARWLVHAQAYDPSGIKSGQVGDDRVSNGKGYPQGVAWAGNLGAIHVEGDTLRETLLLNLIATDTDNLRADEEDRPTWRFDPPGPGPLTGAQQVFRPYGLRDLYTWQGRRIRLSADQGGVYGVLLCYGDPLAAANMHTREPMTAWRRSPNQERKLGKSTVYLPQQHDPDRSAWRGLASLLVGGDSAGRQRGDAAERLPPLLLEWIARLSNETEVLDVQDLVRTRLVGAVYGTQQSVIDEVVADRLVMTVALLHQHNAELAWEAIAAVDDAETAVQVLGWLAADLAQAAGMEPDAHRTAARDRGFGALDGEFRDWLVSLRAGVDPEERRDAWQDTARRVIRGIGDELIEQAGETAWVGRLVDDGKTWLTSAHAENRFHRRLVQKLSRSSSDDTAGV
ncbi:type I-E CRISPR-associated protein Cse1/CasA [Lipingzhangella sp. LS1_29]|uniref:Type I-E CRISPR-associated protein Cse1/CasA n=1 Tax=Lipingzhangella rawalii TaxID=2055835 RepID=A0ABU2HAF1_9ACTN|nr:type I-E CRISPR-associated protein Cse1/CasA [Lipingzhangella rawalii]MDS1272256.1 type I-E CRISPR-associated protein Cse1/CasA [Lipingzhangella rawalii]